MSEEMRVGGDCIHGEPLGLHCSECEAENRQLAREEELQSEENRLLELTVGSDALVKSCVDPFDYALKLRSGEIITYSFAKVINKDWIHLDVKPKDEQIECHIPFPAPRGMDVRISEIVWVVDAPFGS